jgi:RNA-binding protein Musashi
MLIAEDRKMFIGGLSWETREPQLKEYFEKFGTVESVNLKMNPLTGKSRCFAFVVFKSPADVVSTKYESNFTRKIYYFIQLCFPT